METGISLDKMAKEQGAALEDTLDTSGLHCPMPVLLTKRRLRRLPTGARLTVHASDPLAGLDLANFCREEGHALLAITADDEGTITALIEKC